MCPLPGLRPHSCTPTLTLMELMLHIYGGKVLDFYEGGKGKKPTANVVVHALCIAFRVRAYLPTQNTTHRRRTKHNNQLRHVGVKTNGMAHTTTNSTYFLPYKIVQICFGRPREAHYPAWSLWFQTFPVHQL